MSWGEQIKKKKVKEKQKKNEKIVLTDTEI